MAWTAFTVLLVVAAIRPAWKGARLIGRALRETDDPESSLWLIRGIRGVVVAIGVVALAAGLGFDQRWLVAFGVVFLAEELYETGVVALVLRASARESERAPAIAR